MEAVSQVNIHQLSAQLKNRQAENQKAEVQPIDVVDLSEKKADLKGSTGAIINETVGTEEKSPAAKNETMDLEEVEQGINDYLKSAKTDIRIEIHEETNTPIFKIVRSEDNEVIKEIPPEEVLDLIKRIEDMAGSLCDCKA